jgi:HNH endonuclease
MDIREKLLSLIQVVQGPLETECWVWVGGRNNSGYGTIHRNGWPEGTHRTSWQVHRGPIPDGLWVLHKCDVPSCCRPDHLFLGTAQDNIDDMMAKGRHRYRAKARRAKKHTIELGGYEE